MLWAVILAAAGAVAAPSAEPLAGMYDGSQMEMAVGLELREDGRFRYGLSYGALDEEAEGSWVEKGGAVYLTSDPVKAPSILLASETEGPPGVLRISLDSPRLTPQLFELVMTTAGGETRTEQLGEEGLEVPIGGRDVSSVKLQLPMFDIECAPVATKGAAGRTLNFRFDANDLGKVAFQGERLGVDAGELVLNRHERLIRFRRVEGE